MTSKGSTDWPLKKEGYSQVKSLIDSIENDRNAEPFMAPVEWEGKYPRTSVSVLTNIAIEMGLLDYPQIVKSPMDLGTVKENLMSAKYSTYEDVFNDIQLIWDNCKLYNMMGSEIYKICEKMEKSSKRQIQKFRAAHGLPAPIDKNAPPRKRSTNKPDSKAKGSQEENKKQDELAES